MAEIKRLHYYDHQYLQEPDFTAEQSYHKEMRYRHNRSLHTYGVVYGLKVAGNGVSEIVVSAGMALDSAGRELVLEAPAKVAVNLAAGDSRFVIIKFSETRTDEPEEQYRVSVTDRTRWTEKPLVELSEDAPADVGLNLVLGKVTGAQNSLKIEDGGYPNNRRYSGASGEGHFSKVGIGTTAPAPNHKLDVNGNINYNQLTKLDVADNFTAIVRAADFKLGHSGRRGNPGRALVDNKEALVLNFGDDWAKTEIHGGTTYIKGKVGIGTTNPGVTLDVNGDLRVRSQKIYMSHDGTQNSNNDYISYDDSPHLGSGGVYSLHADISRGAGWNSPTAALSAKGGYFSGSVGIGTENPGAKLEVAGDIKVSGRILAPEGTLRDAGGGWVRTYGATGWINGTHGGGWYMVDSTWIRSYGSKNIYHNTGILRTDGTLQVGNNGDRFIVKTDGKVGIGTDNPGARLEINSGAANSSPVLGISTPNLGDFISFFGGRSGNKQPFIAWKRGPLRFGTATSFGGGNFSEKMRITENGNVGIGTTDPKERLQVGGDKGARFHDGGNKYLTWNAYYNSGWKYGGTDSAFLIGASYSGDRFYIQTATPGTKGQNISWKNDIVIKNSNVGIGTANPQNGKLEIKGTSKGGRRRYAWYRYSDGHTGYSTDDPGYSIFTDGRIACTQEIDVISDARTKQILGKSDRKLDLKTVMDIEITDYVFIDRVSMGNRKYKKVIGQQISKVYPQAISTITNVVPDIYRMANLSNGWIDLETSLSVGDKVKLILDDKSEIYEVLEINDRGFRVNLHQNDKVFVYGREVDDCQLVDYEALSMLNISATQELCEMIQHQQKRIDVLESHIASSENPQKTTRTAG